jgi:hypothetical protein
LVHRTDGEVRYQAWNNFTGENAGKEPFNRKRTFGFTSYQDQDYLVMPIEYYDRNNPGKNQWVITVVNITGWPDEYIQEQIKIWRNEMNVTAWVDSDVAFFTPNPDPLVSLTTEKYPDLVERIEKFVDYGNVSHDGKGDRTTLNSPGIVLLGFIVRESSGKYR